MITTIDKLLYNRQNKITTHQPPGSTSFGNLLSLALTYASATGHQNYQHD